MTHSRFPATIGGMVKTIVAGGVALFLVVTMAGAQTAASKAAPGSDAAADAVRDAELARFKAMTSNDLATLKTLLGDDLIYTHSSAQVDSKASYVGSIESGDLKYQSIEPKDIKVRVYGTTAIITAEAAITSISKGQTMSSRLRYTDVWVQRDGRWQMVGWQSTRIP